MVWKKTRRLCAGDQVQQQQIESAALMAAVRTHGRTFDGVQYAPMGTVSADTMFGSLRAELTSRRKLAATETLEVRNFMAAVQHIAAKANLSSTLKKKTSKRFRVVACQPNDAAMTSLNTAKTKMLASFSMAEVGELLREGDIQTQVLSLDLARWLAAGRVQLTRVFGLCNLLHQNLTRSHYGLLRLGDDASTAF
ncbi:hypothetical protein PRIC1_010735 [Phytophthora ramorum]